ncbi:MAG TPA: hypothetical protein VFQ48_08925 [Pseudonocardiaceae bacterium]|nr:hypothetical protein [Pseudonocardiaceae bacterium]
MDDYQIPTTDGRHVTVRYDEQSHHAVIELPPAEEGEEDQEMTVGFELDDAQRFVDALDAIRNRMTGDAAG